MHMKTEIEEIVLAMYIYTPKLVCNCCVNKVIGGALCVRFAFMNFCWYRGFRHRTESDLFLFLFFFLFPETLRSQMK